MHIRFKIATFLYAISVIHARADWIVLERGDELSGNISYVGMLSESNLDLSITCRKSENDVSIILKFPTYLTFNTQLAEMIFNFDQGESLNAKNAIITENEMAIALVTPDSLIISELVKSENIDIKVVTSLGRNIGKKSYKNIRNSTQLKSMIKKCK